MKNAILIILMLLLIGGCRSTERVITKDRFISDSLITHEVKTVQLPVRNVTVIENPCREDSLRPMHQVIRTAGSKLTVKDDHGDLQISLDLDSVISVEREKILRSMEQKTEIREITVTKVKAPRWIWWVLAYAAGISLWVFRTPLLKLIKPI